MNLDDFIVPSSIASPVSGHMSPAVSHDDPSANAPPGIPIRRHQQLQEDDMDFVARASAPSVAPTATIKTGDEFGYVQRHVRKTSIDERRVRSAPSAWPRAGLTIYSRPRGVPTAHPRCRPSTTPMP